MAVLRAAPEPPLVVDLDGSLLRTDVMAESLLLLVKQQPATLLKLFNGQNFGKLVLQVAAE